MAKLTAHPKTYAEAVAALKGKESKKIGNNTWLEFHTASMPYVSVRLHRTNVVTFYADGRVMLNSGGWRTPTTKDRINQFISGNVWSHKSEWFVYEYNDKGERFAVKFYDGLVLGGTYTTPEFKPTEQAQQPDFRVQNEGSIFLLHVLSGDAKEWVKENIGECQWFGCAVVVEHRYIATIVEGIQADGLSVE